MKWHVNVAIGVRGGGGGGASAGDAHISAHAYIHSWVTATSGSLSV